MLQAADLSWRLGKITAQEVNELRQLLEVANLPVAGPENMTTTQYLEHMAVDKKVLDGRIRLVLLEKIGQAFITSEAPQELILRSEEHTSELQSRPHLVCRLL